MQFEPGLNQSCFKAKNGIKDTNCWLKSIKEFLDFYWINAKAFKKQRHTVKQKVFQNFAAQVHLSRGGYFWVGRKNERIQSGSE